jgi:hypothetical protein
MSAAQPDLRSSINDVLSGSASTEQYKRVHEALTDGYGLPTTVVGRNGMTGVPTSAIKRKFADDPEYVKERYGNANPFLAAAMAGREYEAGAHGDTETTRAIDAMLGDESEQTRAFLTERDVEPDEFRALIDETVIGDAAPIEVDPVIVDVQRSAAPELDVIQSVAQSGFQAQFNVINNRDDPVGFLSETEAAGDLESQFNPQDFDLPTEFAEMKRQVGLVKVSDFSQRAMETLDYMDPRETALGQATIAHMLQKAKGLFYGDTSVTAADRSVEDADAFDGIAKKADTAGNSIDKSTVSSGFLEDLLDELTRLIQNTGMTYDRARIMVSPFFYNAVYEEVTPTIRLDGYDADVEYGPQGIALSTEQGSAPITPAPNIRDYAGLSGVGATGGVGDAFIVDELALQFRQLAPMSTVPLGRTGLADRVALFEYYTLVDKSQGDHLRWLQNYDIPTA